MAKKTSYSSSAYTFRLLVPFFIVIFWDYNLIRTYFPFLFSIQTLLYTLPQSHIHGFFFPLQLFAYMYLIEYKRSVSLYCYPYVCFQGRPFPDFLSYPYNYLSAWEVQFKTGSLRCSCSPRWLGHVLTDLQQSLRHSVRSDDLKSDSETPMCCSVHPSSSRKHPWSVSISYYW